MIQRFVEYLEHLQEKVGSGWKIFVYYKIVYIGDSCSSIWFLLNSYFSFHACVKLQYCIVFDNQLKSCTLFALLMRHASIKSIYSSNEVTLILPSTMAFIFWYKLIS